MTKVDWFFAGFLTCLFCVGLAIKIVELLK